MQSSRAPAKPERPKTAAPVTDRAPQVRRSRDAHDSADKAAPDTPAGTKKAAPDTPAGTKSKLAKLPPFKVSLATRLALINGGAVALPIAGSLALARYMFATPAPELVLGGLAAAAATAFAAWAGHRSGRQLAGRLQDLADTLQRLQEGDHAARAKVSTTDEIGRLADRVNRLISSSGAREKRIIENALLDPLTGLHNRTLLADRLRNAIAVSQRTKATFAVTVLDLDRFKFVNDTLGHGAGDMLLKEVAKRLQATVREGDTVARLGGDEFVLLLAGDVETAKEVSQRILQAMREPLKSNGQLIDIGISLGIAMYPDHGQDEASLLRHADVAMYRSKRSQAGVVVFDGDPREVRRSYLSMLGELRTALDKNQFELDYQPKLDLKSGLIVGVEGLLRWKHPTRGRVPPGEFIPFAEQTGFMREITRWVLAEGARFAAQMQRAGLNLRVSVNVAAQDIQSPDFYDMVREVLNETKLEPKNLCLEITESGMVSEAESALKNLLEIGKLGVALSVDDFGTGYATLKQLQELPVDELKIDRSFVSGMHQNRGNQSIIRATIELAKQLGLSVVAEGVETVRELRALAAMGCDEVQGYYVAKPMSPADLVTWIEMRHALYASSRANYFEMLTAEK